MLANERVVSAMVLVLVLVASTETELFEVHWEEERAKERRAERDKNMVKSSR